MTHWSKPFVDLAVIVSRESGETEVELQDHYTSTCTVSELRELLIARKSNILTFLHAQRERPDLTLKQYLEETQ